MRPGFPCFRATHVISAPPPDLVLDPSWDRSGLLASPPSGVVLVAARDFPSPLANRPAEYPYWECWRRRRDALGVGLRESRCMPIVRKRADVDDKPEAHVPCFQPLVCLVDLLSADDFDFGPDSVRGAEI